MRPLLTALALSLFAAGCDPAAPEDPGPPDTPDPPSGPFTLAFTRVPVAGNAGPVPTRDVSVSVGGHLVVLLGSGEVTATRDGGATWFTCEGLEFGVSAVAFRPDGERIFLGGNGEYGVRTGDCATLEASGPLVGPTESFEYPVNDAVWFEDVPGGDDLLLAMGRPDQSDGALVYGEWNGYRWNWSRMVPNAPPSNPQGPASGFTAVGVTDDDTYYVGLVEYRSGLRQPRLMARQEGATAEWAYLEHPADVPLLPPAGIATAGRYGDPIVYLYRSGTSSPADHWLIAETGLGVGRAMTPEGVDSEATIHRIRFDAEDRLWLATSRGLYRSDRAVTSNIE